MFFCGPCKRSSSNKFAPTTYSISYELTEPGFEMVKSPFVVCCSKDEFRDQARIEFFKPLIGDMHRAIIHEGSTNEERMLFLCSLHNLRNGEEIREVYYNHLAIVFDQACRDGKVKHQPR